MIDDDDKLVTDVDARTMFGGISRKTATRWEHDPDIRFPPRITIGRSIFRELKALRECRERLKNKKKGPHPNLWLVNSDQRADK